MSRLLTPTDSIRPRSLYSDERVPLNVAPEVRERLSNLLYRNEFMGTGIGYSQFIDRACEIAEANLAEQDRVRGECDAGR